MTYTDLMEDKALEPYLVMVNLNSIANFDDKSTIYELDLSLMDGLEYTKHPEIVYFESEEDREESGSTSLVRDAIDGMREAGEIRQWNIGLDEVIGREREGYDSNTDEA